jgi:hypothetical protein
MCEAAEEIQAMRAPVPPSNSFRFNDGDWFAAFDRRADHRDEIYSIDILGTITESPELSLSTPGEVSVEIGGWNEGGGYYAKKVIWLPRLDQLLELLSVKRLLKLFASDQSGFALLFYKMIEHGENLECAWLELVMSQRYKKVWNGEKWV